MQNCQLDSESLQSWYSLSLRFKYHRFLRKAKNKTFWIGGIDRYIKRAKNGNLQNRFWNNRVGAKRFILLFFASPLLCKSLNGKVGYWFYHRVIWESLAFVWLLTCQLSWSLWLKVSTLGMFFLQAAQQVAHKRVWEIGFRTPWKM